MGKLTVRTLRAVLTGTVLIQVLMVWTLIDGNDPEDGSLPLTSLRLMGGIGAAILGVAVIVLVLRMLLARASPATRKQRS